MAVPADHLREHHGGWFAAGWVELLRQGEIRSVVGVVAKLVPADQLQEPHWRLDGCCGGGVESRENDQRCCWCCY